MKRNKRKNPMSWNINDNMIIIEINEYIRTSFFLSCNSRSIKWNIFIKIKYIWWCINNNNNNKEGAFYYV